ncbi:hypothetical protein N0V85_000774 [Neurospora sp. IMI 360204]|nr:hypothetical protein N0V85_000774 [Neurospora sp. IMI 360204]
MATTGAIPPAEEAWKAAQKLRAAIHKETQSIQHGGPGSNEEARFQKIEKLMENYRLHCVSIIWTDIRAASELDVEQSLWSTHSMVTNAYRNAIGKIQGSGQAVHKRSIEKLYLAFLKTTQYFYKGYLQRVCARYNMKELKRIARMADLEVMSVPEEDRVDATAANLEGLVTASCHRTLVYMGDLARYRTLIRSKDRRFDTALAYYSMANDLMPESGFAHHQSGHIYATLENHLEVVYHFYRAIACDKPHPNAPANLETEFKTLRKRKAAAAAKGSDDAMISWFVKLHAFYSKGEEFNERKELEAEVDTRLALALTKSNQADVTKVLLKMVLINITAYVVGKKNVEAGWTAEKSLSCQFILLQNVRVIHTISRLLHEEVQDILRRPAAPGAASAKKADTASRYTATFQRTLPLLRVYMTWLCSYSKDIVDFQAYLEPLYGNMCKALARALTVLFELWLSDTNLKSIVPYQFPEDEETIGIKCLNGPDLHDGCQLSYDPTTCKPKPRAEDVKDASFTEDDIAFTRIFDVLFCAIDLAERSTFPLMVCKLMEDSREVTKFAYAEGGKQQPVAQPEVEQRPASETGLPITEDIPSPIVEQLPANVPVVDTVTAPVAAPVTAPVTAPIEEVALDSLDEFAEDRDFYRDPKEIQPPVSQASASRAPMAPQAASNSEYSIDAQMYQLLSDFLAPPDTTGHSRKPSSHGPDETSYGIGSATANELRNAFGSPSPGSGSGQGSASGSASGSATARGFQQLPWNYFYTPGAADNDVPRSSVGCGTPGSWGGHGSPYLHSKSMSNTAMPSGSSITTSQSTVEQQLANQLASLIPSTSTKHQAASPRGAWPELGQTSASHSRQRSSVGQAGSSWNATVGNPPGLWGDMPNSPFSSMTFSGATSSLPPVNSPWGLPAKSHWDAIPNRNPSVSAAPKSAGLVGRIPPGFGPLHSNSSPSGTYGNGGQFDAVNGFGQSGMATRTAQQNAFNQSNAGAYATSQVEEYNRQALMNAWANDYGRTSAAFAAAPPGFGAGGRPQPPPGFPKR